MVCSRCVLAGPNEVRMGSESIRTGVRPKGVRTDRFCLLCRTLPGNMRYTFHNSWPTALKIGDAGHMVKAPKP